MMPAARLRAIMVAFALCNCSLVIPEDYQRTEPVPPRDYRELVAKQVPKYFVPTVYLGELEISRLRRDGHYFGGEWSACLKIDARGRPQLFTVFFHQDEVVQMGLAVQVDQCETETFEPFPVATMVRKPDR